MTYTRRGLGRLALASIPLASTPAAELRAELNSHFGGVDIGAITYSFREMPDPNNADAILNHMVKLGLDGIELMSDPAEAYAGAPVVPTGGSHAAQMKAAEELKKWRLAGSMEKFKELRKKYNAAGVRIYAFRLELTKTMSDGEYEYAFNVGDALGVSHLTMEHPGDAGLTKRIGDFATRRKMYVGYHAHTNATPMLWDEALAQSKYNAINLDVGHYTTATNSSPIPFIKKNHARIMSMHLKDRKYQTKGGDIVPWGTGDTPLREILQLMKTEKYTFPGTIELEYRTPPGSSVMAEMAKCIQFCKAALA